MIRVENICYSFNTDPLLNDVSFDVSKGSCIGLLGPSGSGKSTLANIIAGHIKPMTGRITVNGRDMTKNPGRHVFLINQENDLFPWQNVVSQITFAQKVKNKDQVKSLIGMVRLTGFEEYYPSQLSGGMKKRLSIARALAVNPELIIFDESFSFLDLELKFSLLKDLRDIWEKTGRSICMITHDERDFENFIMETIHLKK